MANWKSSPEEKRKLSLTLDLLMEVVEEVMKEKSFPNVISEN